MFYVVDLTFYDVVLSFYVVDLTFAPSSHRERTVQTYTLNGSFSTLDDAAVLVGIERAFSLRFLFGGSPVSVSRPFPGFGKRGSALRGSSDDSRSPPFMRGPSGASRSPPIKGRGRVSIFPFLGLHPPLPCSYQTDTCHFFILPSFLSP